MCDISRARKVLALRVAGLESDIERRVAVSISGAWELL